MCIRDRSQVDAAQGQVSSAGVELSASEQKLANAQRTVLETRQQLQQARDYDAQLASELAAAQDALADAKGAVAAGQAQLETQPVSYTHLDVYKRQIEVTVFLCTAATQGTNCDAGHDATDAQRDVIRKTLESNAEVAAVTYETKDEVFVQFKEVYKDSSILGTMTAADMQDNFRVKLKNPEDYQGVVSAVQGLPGVQKVQDLRGILEPVFAWLNLARVATVGASLLLLLAAALQIGNTIRMAAFSRRRELGIMRLLSLIHI